MNKIGLVLVALVVLTGCRYDGILPLESDKICLDGVAYHKVIGSGQRFAVAVAYNTDGTIQTCDQS